MQKYSLCILNCVWISIFVSGFYLHSLNMFHTSYMNTVFLKAIINLLYSVFYCNFFIWCWVSSYKHFHGHAQSTCCSLQDQFLILPALWIKSLFQSGKHSAADIGLCAKYWAISTMQYGKQRCNMIFQTKGKLTLYNLTHWVIKI